MELLVANGLKKRIYDNPFLIIIFISSIGIVVIICSWIYYAALADGYIFILFSLALLFWSAKSARNVLLDLFGNEKFQIVSNRFVYKLTLSGLSKSVSYDLNKMRDLEVVDLSSKLNEGANRIWVGFSDFTIRFFDEVRKKEITCGKNIDLNQATYLVSQIEMNITTRHHPKVEPVQ